MFWKFGFHNASSIDTLLDKDIVTLEAILDEDDLLQECKSQNTRLNDYFQRKDVLQRLFGYVTGDIEGEQEGKFKYPYIATEVLCSEIWSIVETCLNHTEQLLTPFWDAVLNRHPEDVTSQNVMASYFSKINGVFISKKPAEMLAFIQAQPSVVERLLKHIESPPFVDLLFRIIQLDEYPSGSGVLEWLSAERLIPRLVDMLSPFQTITTHSAASELIKGIISMSAPSPGTGFGEGLQNGTASNLFARQLAQKYNIMNLVGYMLDDLVTQDPSAHTSSLIPYSDGVVSSGTHSIGVIIELIRKNNSDYFEPYLFHTLRNRLIQVQQQLQGHNLDGREVLEHAMQEMVHRMGVVNLGPLLEVMSERLEYFQKLLREPRSMLDPISATVGQIIPLTFERFRICELYAELLHCSNMSLLNRPPEFSHLYDADGRLQGGLPALEELARVIAIGTGNEDQDHMNADNEELEPAQELPVSAGLNSSLIDSDDEEGISDDDPSSSDDEVMEEIAMHEEGVSASPPLSPLDDEQSEYPPLIVPSSPNATPLSRPTDNVDHDAAMARSPSETSPADISPHVSGRRSSSSRRSLRRSQMLDVIRLSALPIGDMLKRKFIDSDVLPTLLDLFFAFPWNNFLHSVVYDFIHQILTGRVDTGLNRELVIGLFRDGRLLSRIVDGQRQNDVESSKCKGARLGYMGHLTLISEDVISALEHYPADLRLVLAQYAPQPAWDDYVGGRYHETKKKDTSLLGGGKPAVSVAGTRSILRWKVDEEDSVAPTGNDQPLLVNQPFSEMKGEFRRTPKLSRESSADFGISDAIQGDIESGGPSQFARYLEQEISSGITSTRDDGSDEDDDEGWLSHSKFDLGLPPVSARAHHFVHRRPLSPGGFEDTFNASEIGGSSTAASPFVGNVGAGAFDDAFGDDDDHFGPFSDAAAVSDNDPFSLTSLSDDADDSADSFGDFGDFHSGDGHLTPTAGSWTFASDASMSSGSDDAEIEDGYRNNITINSPDEGGTVLAALKSS